MRDNWDRIGQWLVFAAVLVIVLIAAWPLSA
jgi:hypothetical protein